MERAPLGPIWVAIAWILYGIAFLAGVDAGVNLAALVLVPVGLTTVGRRPVSALAVGVFVGAGHLVAMNAVDLRPPLPPVIIGALATTFVGAMVAFTHSVVGRVVEETDTAVRARQRADEVQTVYRSLYEGVPVGLWRTRPDGTILEVNPALAAMFGYSVNEILGQHAGDLYMDPTARGSLIESLIEDGIQRGNVLSMRHRDGHPVFMRVSTQVVRNDDGSVGHLDGVGVDITSEVVSERRRIASDERFRWAFESAPIGMALISGDLTIIRANRALEQFLGYEPGELDGLDAKAVSDEGDMDENLAIREAAAFTESATYSMRKRYIRKDGEPVVGFLTATRLASDQDDLTVSFVVDLADQVKAQEALESLVKSKDEFLATVSHELRTPLTVVHGMAHELRDNWEAFQGGEGRELAGLIADQSSELAFLVEDLLVVARAEAGTLEVTAERVDLDAEIASAVASVPVVETGRVNVSTGGAIAWADRLRVRQIVRNLLTNAHRYGGETVEVRVEDLPDLALAVIQVRDDGRGVPQALVSSIFEPYERAHSLGVVTEAVGLGLTVSRTLAESMGGSLEYRRDDDWSVFELSLRRGDSSTDSNGDGELKPA